MISIRTTAAEEAIYKDLADFMGLSVSALIRQTMSEMIEEYYDTKDAEKAYQEYLEAGKPSRPISELWDELGL